MKSVLIFAIMAVCLGQAWEDMDTRGGMFEERVNRFTYKADHLIKICEVMRPLIIGTGMQQYEADSCQTMVGRITSQDQAVTQTLLIGMWNKFLNGFDAPIELFINLEKEFVDYGD